MYPPKICIRIPYGERHLMFFFSIAFSDVLRDVAAAKVCKRRSVLSEEKYVYTWKSKINMKCQRKKNNTSTQREYR